MKNFEWNIDDGAFVYTGNLTNNVNYLIRVCEKVIYWFDKTLDQYVLVIVDIRGDIVEHFDTEEKLQKYLESHNLV